jgi:sortase (surface protein transpeptidase)
MTAPATRKARGNRLLAAASITLAVLGYVRLTSADAESGPPVPTAAVQGTLPPANAVPSAGAPPPRPLAYAVPTRIEIPKIDVHANVIKVGVNPDGTVGTPPLSDAKVAGWYDGSAAPGQTGAAVIDAHVDSAMVKGFQGAFFSLSAAKPGMLIDVTRADGTVAVFTVDEVQVTLKTAFPTEKVYAPTSYPALRLITCGGGFDQKAHEYRGNTIVYAHLSGERPTLTLAR